MRPFGALTPSLESGSTSLTTNGKCDVEAMPCNGSNNDLGDDVFSGITIQPSHSTAQNSNAQNQTMLPLCVNSNPTMFLQIEIWQFLQIKSRIRQGYQLFDTELKFSLEYGHLGTWGCSVLAGWEGDRKIIP